MTDELVNLEPLDPTRDPARLDALVARIAHDGMSARSARPAGTGTLLVLARWTRPLLAAAATIAVLASGVLMYHPALPVHPPSLLEGLGVPAPFAAWAESGRSPDLDELLAGMAESMSPATSPERQP
ncbi:MAG: hypothetical protein U0133_20875 [Gemmatimonadales bacterium]